ncbi:MAG: hypothetical protein ACOZQL_40450 [Myxococcota bacterium]
MNLTLQQLERRYVLPAGAESAGARLEAHVSAVIEGALSGAAEALGLPDTVEVCLRTLHVPVEVSLDASETQLAAALTRAFTQRLATAVRGEERADELVVYRTRTHVLADVATRALAGDVSRAWAWAQLGLWPAVAPSGERATREAAARALVANASEVPHALWLMPPAVAVNLVLRLGPGVLREVVRGVLVAHGQPGALVERLVAAVAHHAHDAQEPAAHATPIANAAADAREAQDPQRAHDGALAQTDAPPARVAARVERAVREMPWAALLSRQLSSAARAELAAHEVLALAKVLALAVAAPELLRQAEAVLLLSRRANAPTAEQTQERAPRRPATKPAATGARTTTSETSATVSTSERAADEEAATVTEDAAEGTWSDWAGLLFLLHPLTKLEVARWHEQRAALAGRPLRWVLHALALRLAPVAPADAAALGLAGLPPDAEPPSEVEPPATDDELAAVEALRGELLVLLRRDLERLGASLPKEEAQLLHRICRRGGRLDFSGRWLEATLSLDEVDTELRRAGLDLDPGWLPWLGAVVRFRYA